MLKQLTEDQIAQIPAYVERWTKIGLSTEPLDFERAKKAVAMAYQTAGLSPPKFYFVFDSPFSAAIAAEILKKVRAQVGDQVMAQVGDQVWAQVMAQVGDQVWDQVGAQVRAQVMAQVMAQVGDQVGAQIGDQVGDQVWDQVGDQVWDQVWDQVGDQIWDQVRAQIGDQVRAQIGAHVRDQVWDQVWDQVGAQVWDQVYGAHDAGGLSFYAFFKEVCGLECCAPLEGLIELAQHCGWWAPYRGAAILQHRPREIHKTTRGLHRDGGPAVLYRDGFSVWVLNGVRVPQWLAETPSHELDPKRLLKIDNAQVRAEFVRKVGAERLIHKLGASVIDRSGDYQLLTMEFGFDPRIVRALKMLNPSVPELWHVEFVSPDCDTVSKALNFRNGTYAAPRVLT